MDGQSGDWDLSGGIFACGQLEHFASAAWCSFTRWKDEASLNNPAAQANKTPRLKALRRGV